MTYSKPEIAVLGDAARVIQDTQLKISGSVFDGQDRPQLNPAYDLDE